METSYCMGLDCGSFRGLTEPYIRMADKTKSIVYQCSRRSAWI